MTRLSYPTDLARETPKRLMARYQAIKRADRAMSLAKRAGKNRAIGG